jgi:hypothetical protein
MAKVALDVKNPSVSLFGFHLSHDLSQPLGTLRADANQLWAEVANLSQPLQSPQLADLTAQINRHPNTQASLEKQPLPLLGTDPATGQANVFAIPTQIENCPLALTARPYQLNDSYAIDITLESKQTVISATDFFKACNPTGCLLADQFKVSLAACRS